VQVLKQRSSVYEVELLVAQRVLGHVELPHLHVWPRFTVKARVDVDRYDVSGVYFFPLLKAGKCSFHATLESTDGMVQGETSGEIDLEVIGACSIREFRTKLRDQVDEKVLDYARSRGRGSGAPMHEEIEVRPLERGDR